MALYPPPPLILGDSAQLWSRKGCLPWTPRDQDLHENSNEFRTNLAALPPRFGIFRATLLSCSRPNVMPGCIFHERYSIGTGGLYAGLQHPISDRVWWPPRSLTHGTKMSLTAFRWQIGANGAHHFGTSVLTTPRCLPSQASLTTGPCKGAAGKWVRSILVACDQLQAVSRL